MNDVMVRVENLSKLYYIGAKQQKADTLVHTIANSVSRTAHRMFNSRLARLDADQVDELWALKDISFELQRGKVLGIIGENGSGKSTLLKILSRVTAPTTGRVELFGRVGSLLEVGTGFHPDLTGRENVYLNGAVLGMKRAEIDSIFDEIVDFSGVEKFIDTPVKHYSSGMYIRLAFSVAAHFDPEILILDEVLAVGDAAFQKKSLEKMESAARSGKTVLFVSHGMQSITRLCDQGIYLKHGKSIFQGPITDVVGSYLKDVQKIDDEKLKKELNSIDVELPALSLLDDPRKRAPWSTQIIFKWLSTHDIYGNLSSHFETGDSLLIRIGFELSEALIAYGQINVLDYSGMRIMQLNVTHNGNPLKISGKGYIEIEVNDIRLLAGIYVIMFDIYSDPAIQSINWRDSVGDTVHIKITPGNYLGGGGLSQGQVPFAQKSFWKVQQDK